MEIDVARALHAVAQIGNALDEIRIAFRPGPAGMIRVHIEDKVVELPLALMAAGVAVALLMAGPLRRRRREYDSELRPELAAR